MSKADGGLRKIMHARMKAFGHFQAVETGLVGAGVPDTNFCIEGVEGWIECKRTAAWSVTIRREQVGWCEQRVRNGGRVFCAVRRMRDASPRLPAADELWLLRHSAMRLLVLGAGLNSLPKQEILAVWPGGPEHWGWQALAKLLVS